MAKFSQDEIARLLSTVNIVEHISQSVKLVKKGNDFQGLCPFHQEKTPSFTVSDKKQFFYCFGCHKHGNVIDYVMTHQQLTFPEALTYLAELHNITLEQTHKDSPEKSDEKKKTLHLNKLALDYYRHQLTSNTVALKYLKDRGITDATIKLFNIGYATDQWQGLLNHTKEKNKKTLDSCGLFANKNDRTYDRMRDRIIFPIHDLKRQIIGFGGRVISDSQQPKYLNSPDTPVFHKSNVLYGLTQCIEQKNLETLLVVEGYMDVIMLHQYGITCAVASLGTAFTNNHLKQLQRYAQKDIVFCFDGDNAGQRAMQHAIDLILANIDDRHRFKFLMLPDKEDPDSVVINHGSEHFKQLMANAESLESILEKRWSKELDLDLLQDQAQFLKRAQADLKICKESFFKKLLLKSLEQKYSVVQTKTAPAAAPEKKPPPSAKQPVSGWIECLSCLIDKPSEIERFAEELNSIKSALPNALVITLSHLITYAQSDNKALLLESTREHPEIHNWISLALKLSEPQNPVQFIQSYQIYLKKRVLEKRIESLLNVPNMTDDQKSMLKNFIALKHAIKQRS